MFKSGAQLEWRAATDKIVRLSCCKRQRVWVWPQSWWLFVRPPYICLSAVNNHFLMATLSSISDTVISSCYNHASTKHTIKDKANKNKQGHRLWYVHEGCESKWTLSVESYFFFFILSWFWTIHLLSPIVTQCHWLPSIVMGNFINLRPVVQQFETSYIWNRTFDVRQVMKQKHWDQG